MYSDEDEDFSSGEGEEGSDSEPLLETEDNLMGSANDSAPSAVHQLHHHHLHHHHRRLRKQSSRQATNARQRNLKQKFVALLKKFKVADPEALEDDQVSLDQKLSGEFQGLELEKNTMYSFM